MQKFIFPFLLLLSLLSWPACRFLSVTEPPVDPCPSDSSAVRLKIIDAETKQPIAAQVEVWEYNQKLLYGPDETLLIDSTTDAAGAFSYDFKFDTWSLISNYTIIKPALGYGPAIRLDIAKGCGLEFTYPAKKYSVLALNFENQTDSMLLFYGFELKLKAKIAGVTGEGYLPIININNRDTMDIKEIRRFQLPCVPNDSILVRYYTKSRGTLTSTFFANADSIVQQTIKID